MIKSLERPCCTVQNHNIKCILFKVKKNLSNDFKWLINDEQ